MILVLLEGEARALEWLLHLVQALQQRLAAGNHQADAAAQDLRLAGDQVELAMADIDPHVVDAGHQVGIARQTQAAHVEQGRLDLVLDQQVHMLEPDDVAEILGAAVVLLAVVPGHGCLPLREGSFARISVGSPCKKCGTACHKVREERP